MPNPYDDRIITPRRMFYAAMAIATIVALLCASQLFETNEAGYVQIKQEAGTGRMSVRTEPGLYLQMFSSINTYKISDAYDFNHTEERIPVQFNDGSQGFVGGQIKYRLPSDVNSLLAINADFRSDDAVRVQLVRQIVLSSVRQTASMFLPEDVYSSRRAAFINLINEQIKNGIYATVYSEDRRKDDDNNSFIQRIVQVKMDNSGKPVISEPSTFKRYNVELIQLVINDIGFDEKTNDLIRQRKDSEQQKLVAKSNAERAKQDAITAEAQGRADVAKAEAAALVVKKTAVIESEKLKEVAAQQALQALEEKKAIVARGEAEAQAAQLKVAAGLTPLDKATIDKETAIGVAKELSNVKFPNLLVIGGGSNGNSPLNPFDAVGLKSFIDISKQLSTTTATPVVDRRLQQTIVE